MELKKKLIAEAVAIGDRIAQKKIKGPKGIYWETLNLDVNRKHIWSSADNIYGGNAGILIFYMELYKATQEEKYLSLILQGADTLIKASRNSVGNHSFYTGTLGIACTLWKIGDLVEDNRYHNESVRIAQQCTSQLPTEGKMNDLLNGRAGMILGLLHLYKMSAQEWILPRISILIECVINDLHLGEQGVYWDRSPDFIRGLCGFSHGASGISFVFIELGHHFKNKAFQWLGEEALKYENNYYSEQENNWPDFRKSYYDDEQRKIFEEAYLKKDYTFFTRGRDMSAWCHGAPGIIISRARAYQLTGKHEYLRDLKRAMQKTASLVHHPLASPTLCHGLAGNAMTLLAGNQVVNDPLMTDVITQAAQTCYNEGVINQYYLNGYQVVNEHEDPSLFMGSAGVGYFYLKFAMGHHEESIISPIVNSSGSTLSLYFSDWTVSRIKTKICNNEFWRTFRYIRGDQPVSFSVRSSVSSLKDELMEDVQELVEKSSMMDINIFKLECKKMQLESSRLNSAAYLKTQGLVEKENALLTEEAFNELILAISETIAFGTFIDNGTERNVLYNLIPLGVKEIEVSDIQMVILEVFRISCTVNEAVEKIMNESIEGFEKRHESEIRDNIIGNIRLMVHNAFLLHVRKNMSH